MTDAQTQRWIGGVSFVLILCLLSGWIGRCTCPHEKAVVGASTIDVQSVPTPYPVYVPKLVYKWLPAKVTAVVKESFTSDTATVKDSLTVQPCPDFIAEADSTNDSVRARVWYYSAEQRFRMEIEHTKPLMPLVPLTTITKTNTTYEKRPLWQDIFTHIGAAALGYGIGRLTN